MNQPIRLSGYTRFNFAMGILHGVFYQAGLAISSPTTVLPVFLSHFTGSLALIGLFSAVVTAGGVLPQLVVAHRLEGRARTKPVLVVAIWIRAGAWAVLGVLTWFCTGCGPVFTLISLLVLLLVFSTAGGVANVPFMNLWGKTLPVGLRGRFWGHRQLWGGLLAVGSGWAVKTVLASPIAFPRNYALLFIFSFLLMAFSYIALSSVREPEGDVSPERPPFRSYIAGAFGLFRSDRDFAWFSLTQVATMFFAFAMPFYVLYGKNRLGMPAEEVGVLIAAQMIGGIVSNLLWGWLSDRFGNRSVIRLTAAATVIMPALALLAHHSGWSLLIAVFAISGVIISGSGIGFVNYVLEIAPEPQRPTYIALNGTLNGLFALLPIAGGWVVDITSYHVAFWISLGIAVAALLLSVRLKCLRSSAPPLD